MRTNDGHVDEERIEGLRARLRGEVLVPGDPGYDESRTVWNAMVDRRPAIVARPAGTADVMAGVDFARENDLLLAVKGAGHNIAGNAVCDDGLLLDLSGMDAVSVDPDARTARVGPGATLADFDHEAQAFGLATPVGFNSTTGVAGLTLGGGFGWLSRVHGLTADNLRSAEVVTADGERLRASEDEHGDLFWGLRGGGGNLGVVTDFEFGLHEVGPAVLSGLLVYPFEDAADVLEEYREFAATAPDEAAAWVVVRHAPPLPFLPERWHGEPVLGVAAFYAGEISEGEEVLRPLREVGEPVADAVEPHPYVAWQQAFDPLLAEGARNYWKSHNFETFTDGMIDVITEYGASIPSPESEIAVAHLGGAVNEVPVSATAYPHRDAEFVMNLHTRWTDPGRDEECIAWARELYDAMAPHATGGVYVNFVPEEVGEERAAYRENYDRLAELKAKYDPENLFRMNQNVAPAP